MTEKEEYLKLLSNSNINVNKSTLSYKDSNNTVYTAFYFTVKHLTEMGCSNDPCCGCKVLGKHGLRINLQDTIKDVDTAYYWTDCSTGDCIPKGIAVLCKECIKKGAIPKYRLDRGDNSTFLVER